MRAMPGLQSNFLHTTWLLLGKIAALFLRPPALFCFFLAWFYWGSPWFPAATMSITGTTSEAPSRLDTWWVSGHDLNGYEHNTFLLTPRPALATSQGIPLVITRVGKRGPGSKGKKVVLSNIIIDGKRYFPANDRLPPGVREKNGTLVFHKNGATLRLNIQVQHSLVLEFPAFNTAGLVDVQLGEQTTRHDLYASNNESHWARRRAHFAKSWFTAPDGNFTVIMDWVRYPTKILRIFSQKNFSITSVVVSTEDGQQYTLNNPVPWDGGIHFSLRELTRQLTRYYHPDRLLLQVCFALLTTLLLKQLLAYLRGFNGLKDILLNEQRYLFWGMLGGSCLAFSFWHIAFWPGITSNDSLQIWRAAQIPGMYLGNHPPLNVLLYTYLSMFWNNIAVVPLVQNFCTALLIAYILFSLYRKGLPLPGLLLFYGVLLTSLPIGLYTAVLWKDIPFALVVVLLGHKLAELYVAQRVAQNTATRQGYRNISRKDLIFLILLTLAAAGIRHNGVLFLFIVPVVLLLFGLIRLRPVVIIALFSLALAGSVAFFILPSNQGRSGYLAIQTKRYVQQAWKRVSLNYIQASATNYLGIFNVNQKRMQWDQVEGCLFGRYEHDMLKQFRWNDVYPYLPLSTNQWVKQLQQTCFRLYKKSYIAPWVYMSWNPLHMLFLLPLLPFFVKMLPRAGVFSLFIFIPTAVLVFLHIFNWRYYFFTYLATPFLLPMMVTDLAARRQQYTKKI